VGKESPECSVVNIPLDPGSQPLPAWAVPGATKEDYASPPPARALHSSEPQQRLSQPQPTSQVPSDV